MFYIASEFPPALALQQHFTAIYNEYQQLHAHDFVPWPEYHLYGKGWSVVGLYQDGQPIAQHCKLCPDTAALLATFSGIQRAGFSRLEPGTHIQPHKGRPKNQLRCHLGLVIPDGDLGIRVEAETRSWSVGECLVFDDTLEHEAWNRTEQERIVLLVDINH